jgi:hypothetical protein
MTATETPTGLPCRANRQRLAPPDPQSRQRGPGPRPRHLRLPGPLQPAPAHPRGPPRRLRGLPGPGPPLWHPLCPPGGAHRVAGRRVPHPPGTPLPGRGPATAAELPLQPGSMRLYSVARLATADGAAPPPVLLFGIGLNLMIPKLGMKLWKDCGGKVFLSGDESLGIERSVDRDPASWVLNLGISRLIASEGLSVWADR